MPIPIVPLDQVLRTGWLTVAQAAAITNMAPASIRRLVKLPDTTVHAVKPAGVPRLILISEKDLLRYERERQAHKRGRPRGRTAKTVTEL